MRQEAEAKVRSPPSAGCLHLSAVPQADHMAVPGDSRGARTPEETRCGDRLRTQHGRGGVSARRLAAQRRRQVKGRASFRQ